MEHIDLVSEQERMLWNWCPIEMGYHIWLEGDECWVEGLRLLELDRVLS